jgi:hypothetical protein
MAAVRDRRIERAQAGHPAGIRQRRAGPALHAAQAMQRARSSARTRPTGGQGQAAPGVDGDQPRPRARAAHYHRARAGPRAPRRRRVAPGRP